MPDNDFAAILADASPGNFRPHAATLERWAEEKTATAPLAYDSDAELVATTANYLGQFFHKPKTPATTPPQSSVDRIPDRDSGLLSRLKAQSPDNQQIPNSIGKTDDELFAEMFPTMKGQ